MRYLILGGKNMIDDFRTIHSENRTIPFECYENRTNLSENRTNLSENRTDRPKIVPLVRKTYK